MRSRLIAIVGGGIGGLTAAIALRQAGFGVRVLERAASLRPVGAGITLQVNAMQALSRIGMADAVAQRGQRIDSVTSRRPDGSVRARVGLDRITSELGAPCISIHRGELQAVLLSALGEGVVAMGAETVELDIANEKKPAIQLSTGETVEADAVIGADGVHSAIRRLCGWEPKISTRYTCWRGVVDAPADRPAGPQGTLTQNGGNGWWGNGLAFGCFPLAGHRQYWYATHRTRMFAGHDRCAAKQWLLSRCHGWDPRLVELIESTPCEAVFGTPISEMAPLPTWGRSAVTLLGDAAHPMTPSMGQGGGMAIEDAVVLAQCLASQCLASRPDAADGLRAYEAARRRRTTAMVRVSKRMTAIAHREGPIAAATRLAIPLVPRWVRDRQLRRLYGFDGTTH